MTQYRYSEILTTMNMESQELEVISSSSSSSDMPVENSSNDDGSSDPYEISRIGRRRRASPPGPIVNVNVDALLETTVASAPLGTTTGRATTTATNAIPTANATREQQQQQPTSLAGVEQRFAQYMTLAGTSASVANLSATSIRSMMEESKMPGSRRSEHECSVAPESHNHDHHRDHRVTATTPSTTQRSYSSPSLSTHPNLHLRSHSHSPTLWLEQTARILGQGEQELEHDDDYHSHLLEEHRGLPMEMLHSAILDHDERLNREVEELFGPFLEGDDVHSM